MVKVPGIDHTYKTYTIMKRLWVFELLHHISYSDSSCMVGMYVTDTFQVPTFIVHQRQML